MKGKICSGLLLLLFIMAGSLLNVSSTYSLSHDYVGIPFLSPILPQHFITRDGRSYPDWEYDFTSTIDYIVPDAYFRLRIANGAYDSFVSDISLNYNLSYMELSYNNSTSVCDYARNYSSPIFNISNSNNIFNVERNNSGWVQYVPSQLSGSQFSISSSYDFHCGHRDSFGTNNQPQFNQDSLANGIINCGFSTGTSCQGMFDFRTFARSEFLPDYWFTTDGFYVHSSAIDTDSGIHYNHSFSFKDLFSTPIYSFSSLSIPLFDYNGYFWDSSNLYQGRFLEWRGVFEFDGSFEWNPNISDSSARFDVDVYVPSGYGSNFTVSCTANLRTLPDIGLTQLEYSCPTTLSRDYPWIIPVLVIRGPNTSGSSSPDYVWKTDADWRFGYQYLVTDNDDTPGSSFNNELHGNNIPGDAKNDMSSGNEDWFSSLANLFNFNFINPFAPIFQLFSDQSQCASIPTLAGMLHSEETQVCPWFDSNTRAIVTPVLGIASVMLVFGFAVRWLGSSSGNLFEDSHESENYSFSNRFRRGKK